MSHKIRADTKTCVWKVVRVEDLSQGNIEGIVTSFEFEKRESLYYTENEA